MKALLTLLLLAGTLFSSIAQDEITYNRGKAVEWSDFRGKPDMKAWASAMTATQIKMKATPKQAGVSLKVECVFVPAKSWVKPNHKDHVLLLHERGHFELRELYARMLRKELKELNVTQRNAGRKIKRLYKRYHRKARRINKKYDKETNFSRDKTGQARWYTYIDKELEKYKAYTGTMLFLRY